MLLDTVNGISDQSLGDFEFLIIDDGSTDCSVEIIPPCTDPRIRVIQNEEEFGLTRSLNKDHILARTEYVARMDADDMAVPWSLPKYSPWLSIAVDDHAYTHDNCSTDIWT